jgi:outer membrane protein assembly factor BamD
MTLLRAASVRLLAAPLLAAIVAGCGPATQGAVPPGTLQPDKFLYDNGMKALMERRWLPAREYFRQLVETYTQSPLRPEGKLGLGDTYLGESTPESLVLALNEFREFIAFYPTHPRADYAQYKLGMAHFEQMRAPGRDQTETKSAIAEFQTFISRYPNSSLMPEVQTRLREARDRLSENDFIVGRFYYRIRWYPGAVDRLMTLLKEDAEYSGRDAVYYYLGESLLRLNRSAEALPYFERLVAEFERSEHLEDAQKRIAELKAAQVQRSP